MTNDFPSPAVRHNPGSDPPCQPGTSKRLAGGGINSMREQTMKIIVHYGNKRRKQVIRKQEREELKKLGEPRRGGK